MQRYFNLRADKVEPPPMIKKNVLHLVEYLYLGGIERLLEQLAQATQASANLYFFTYETQTLSGIGKSIQDQGFPVMTYKKSAGRDWKLFKRLCQVIQENKIDVVHTHDFGPMEYAVLLKLRFPHLRLIHTQHTMHHFVDKAHYRLFFQAASYFYFQVIAVSDFVRNLLLESCPLVNRRALVVIPNGVDTEKFSPQKSFGVLSEKLRLVSISRISKEKNLDYLFKTCALLKENDIPFELHHAGTSKSSEETERIKCYLRDQRIDSEVTLHGFSDNPATILARGDIFVSPSAKEGHPVALLEAMASEKICLVSDIPPHRETAQGVLDLFDIQDEKALFNKLKAIYEQNPNFEKMRKDSRALIIKHFSLNSMAGRYVELYQQ